MLLREKVLEVYEIIMGRRLNDEKLLSSYMDEQSVKSLCEKIMLADDFNPYDLKECDWGSHIATRNEIILGYLYFLGRGPESQATITYKLKSNLTRQQLFSSLIKSKEFMKKYIQLISRNSRRYLKNNNHQVNLRFKELWCNEIEEYEDIKKDVVDCFHYILGREPESENVVDWHCEALGKKTLSEMHNYFFASKEYSNQTGKMISYAQNGEDVILWRALKNIENGFYIDVGANDPVYNSVTKWFYDQGWRGVNIEPSDSCYHKLEEMRPEDVNLCVGAGAQEGKLILYDVPGTGFSTIRKDVAESYRKEKNFPYKINEYYIDIITLTAVCEKYASDKDIHFLKIDVEEAEQFVLEGMDFERFRPWIIVIEVRGFSGKINTEWENLILDKGYKHTLYDGINHYYVADEKYLEFGEKISVPVCCLDRYETYAQAMRRKWQEELVKRYGVLRDNPLDLQL